MANLSHSESRRLYSWWWDSHNAPKSSKWLQEKLTDMDDNVKSMIKLIEEDADSFARKAEMYYQKRPKLMKLVEEFYRAYRALAERYSHATGELRHAHKTLAKAFPDQVTLEYDGDSPSKPLPNVHGDDSIWNMEGFPHKDYWEGAVKGLRQLPEMFGGKESVAERIKIGSKKEKDGEEIFDEIFDDQLSQLSTQNQNLLNQVLFETGRAGKAEHEVQSMQKVLEEMQAEKENVLLQYQQCLKNLSKIEYELNTALEVSMILDEKSSRADIEVQTLKLAVIQLEAEKNAGLVKQKECSDRILQLEAMAFQFQEDINGLSNKAIEAECQVKILKDERSRLELEKKAVLHQYQECTGNFLDLQNIISVTGNEATLLKKQAERAETEVAELRKAFGDLKKEKESLAVQYRYCLETISKLEKDLSIMKDDVKRLTDEVLLGTTKLKTAEEKYTVLEISNKSLLVEADNLVKKITMKDQELSRKEKELEELQTCMQDERQRQMKVEATLKTLQDLHSESANDQKTLAQELENLLDMLKDRDVSKIGLEDEFQQINGEDFGLSQTDFSSAVPMKKKKNDILNLREIKERVGKEVAHQIGVSISLQKEISSLKMEIEGLNGSYQALVKQVEAAGLNPKCLGTSITSLLDENSRLEQMCEYEQKEKATLSKKLESMEEVLKKKAVMESSLVDFNSELECSHEKLKALHGEKATLVAEKASLLSQLQCVTENMHNLLEKNAVLENTLSSAKVELEILRVKSKGLEEICELLKNERSHLLVERVSLVFKLENVESRLEYIETRFSGLKEKYADLQKENQTMQCQVEKLEFSLGLERQDRASSLLLSESRLAGLENQIHLFQEENSCKKESQEELDKALKAQFEISVIKKFMKDMEEKNCALVIECQKHVEASKLAEKVITELESESLQQQVEAELLLDEIERLRLGIYQLFRAVETGTNFETEDSLRNEHVLVNHILGSIEEMTSCISRHEDEKKELFVEKAVLLALLEQLELKGREIESLNIHLEDEFKVMAERLAIVQKEKDKLLDINKQLKSALREGRQDAGTLEVEFRNLCVKQTKMQQAYNTLQEDYFRTHQENECFLKNFSDINLEKYQVDQLNDALLLELLETTSQSAVLRSCWEEKIVKVKLLLEDLNRQHEVSDSIMKEIKVLREEQDLLKAENLALKDAVYSLEKEIEGVNECKAQMNNDVLNGKENLMETEARLFDTEMKLQAAENLNLTLCRTIEEMRIDTHESQQRRENLERNMNQLSEKSSTQTKEIVRLNNLHSKLESKLGLLRQEIEENIIREQTLNMELEDMNNEFELWEAEASTFCFDLQVSSVQEVLLKNKVQELTGVCQTLENKCAAKTTDIEQMKGKICLMQNEITGLKSQLNVYVPIVASFEGDITLLERYVLHQKKLKAEYGQEKEMSEVTAHHSGDASQTHNEDQSLLSLQNLQMRVKEVGKLMEEVNKPQTPRRSNSHCKQESEIDEIDWVKSRRGLMRVKYQHSRKKLYLNEHNGSPKLQRMHSRASEVRIETSMKDIPLDQVAAHPLLGMGKKGSVGLDNQMLELLENADGGNGNQTIGESLRMPYNSTGTKYKSRERYENVIKSFEFPLTESDMEEQFTVDKLELSTRITEPDQDVNDRTILEGLYTDAQKLEILQTKIQILRRKLRPNTKSRKDKNMHLETVLQQLQEADDAIANLVDLNGQLVKNIEECPTDEMATPRLKEIVKTWRMKVVEQARKGSDRIDRLQLELQKIQYMLLELEDEKEEKQREKIIRSSRTIMLKDFVYSGRRSSTKRKKGPPLFVLNKQPV